MLYFEGVIFCCASTTNGLCVYQDNNKRENTLIEKVHLGENIKNLSSYAHVVHTTAKQVISRPGKNENDSEMYKMKISRAKHAKLLCFIVKYANL